MPITRPYLRLLLIVLLLPAFSHAQVPVQWQAKWIQSTLHEDSLRAAQYFQKSFTLGKKYQAARLYITCHGLYEAHLNGKRVGKAYLTPGWTDYNKRLQYQVYDVTDLLQPGNNTLQVTVGDGWYRGNFGFFSDRRDFYGKELALLGQLEITGEKNKKILIKTDSTWQSATGPIRESEINYGETIDANVQPANWAPVRTEAFGYDKLIPSESNPITQHETFQPLKIFTTPKGEQVIDFGQNLVGWVRVKVRGATGTKITIRHAEVLDKTGNFYTDNLRSAKATATYILNGKGEESFEPHFTYFGFRYITVSGYPGALQPEDFEAVALYADMQPTGSFECSNKLVNQLQHNIQWGQKGNFLDVPTDCPQRDERLGWTGDAQVFFRTAAYNFNVEPFFRKWLKDVALEQRADGAVPHVVPDILNGDGGSAGWSDVATIVPWNMYLVYGHAEILTQQYPSMKAWVDYITQHSVNDLWNTGTHFGDWLSYRAPDDGGTDAITDKHEIAQCFYAHSTQLLINAARVLGKTADITAYEALLTKVKTAYNKEYVTPSGRLLSNTQTAYVLALQFDMLPEEKRPMAVQYLVNNIKAYHNHLTTGFLGTPYLCHVLTRFGYTDVAYQLLLQESYPGWLYPVKKGATTIWERWDGIRPDGSFQTPEMNSFNHYAYGAIGDWLYRVVAGIDTDPAHPGYQKIIIQPRPGGGLTYCKASLATQYGTIRVNWRIENGKFLLDVTVPPNTTATVQVPDAAGKTFTAHEVGAGEHHF